MKNGLKTAVIYSLKPYQLGFCGPEEKKIEKDVIFYLIGRSKKERKIREFLKDFKAAFPYYLLIARSNGIKDPFSKKVVEAYWIGNQLLEKVKVSALKNLISQTFQRPDLANLVNKFSRPHHSFHVLVIGSITGRIILKGNLLDFCRIGYGQIVKIDKDKVWVKYQPLIVGRKINLGDFIEKKFAWPKKIVPQLKIGDWVSFHWGQICQVLNQEQIKNLDYYTKLSIKNANKEKSVT